MTIHESYYSKNKINQDNHLKYIIGNLAKNGRILVYFNRFFVDFDRFFVDFDKFFVDLF